MHAIQIISHQCTISHDLAVRSNELLTETYTAAKAANVACCDGKDFLQ